MATTFTRDVLTLFGNIIPIMPYINHTQTLLLPCRRIINFYLIRTLNRQKLHFIPKQRNGGILISQTNPPGTTLNSTNYLSEPMNVAVCLSLIVHSQATEIKMSVFEFLQD